ncbi:His/Gly/Thr/Pro-type tRNA ligase C-terminal domain-containing protein [Chloroflexota bacterium]
MKAQLRQSNTLGMHYTIIIGEDELKNGTVILRDMTTAEQKSVPADKIQEQLQ